MAAYRQLDILCGKRVLVKPKGREQPDGQYEATAVDFTDTGALRVRTADGQLLELATGDVTIRPG